MHCSGTMSCGPRQGWHSMIPPVLPDVKEVWPPLAIPSPEPPPPGPDTTPSPRPPPPEPTTTVLSPSSFVSLPALLPNGSTTIEAGGSCTWRESAPNQASCTGPQRGLHWSQKQRHSSDTQLSQKRESLTAGSAHCIPHTLHIHRDRFPTKRTFSYCSAITNGNGACSVSDDPLDSSELDGEDGSQSAHEHQHSLRLHPAQ